MVKRPLYCSFVSMFSDYKSHEVDKMSPNVEYVPVNRRQLLCWVALSCSPFRLRNGSGCAVEVRCDLAASAVQEQTPASLVMQTLKNQRLEGLGDSVQVGSLISPVQVTQWLFRELVRRLSERCGGLQNQNMTVGWRVGEQLGTGGNLSEGRGNELFIIRKT